MKKWIVVLFAMFSSLVFAAGTNVSLDKAGNDLTDKASLQNGAKLFMDYCFGCHSMQYQRYQRVATDLDIPLDVIKQRMMFDPNAKIGDLMENAIPDQDAVRWFGVPAPDLTLVARVRGTDWLYSYLHSFYADPSKTFGVNNLVFPNVGMPHALEELQGTPWPVYQVETTIQAEPPIIVGIKTDESGEMSADEYDNAVRDIVNFLEYSGDPTKLEREALGWWVMAFLILFTTVVILLQKEYWRDVH